MLKSPAVQCSIRGKGVLWVLSAKGTPFNTRNNTYLIADKYSGFHSPLVKNSLWVDTSAGVSSHLCEREWERREMYFHTWTVSLLGELPIGKTVYGFCSAYQRGNKAHICMYRQWKLNYMWIILYFTAWTYCFGTAGSKNSSFWNKHLYTNILVDIFALLNWSAIKEDFHHPPHEINVSLTI